VEWTSRHRPPTTNTKAPDHPGLFCSYASWNANDLGGRGESFRPETGHLRRRRSLSRDPTPASDARTLFVLLDPQRMAAFDGFCRKAASLLPARSRHPNALPHKPGSRDHTGGRMARLLPDVTTAAFPSNSASESISVFPPYFSGHSANAGQCSQDLATPNSMTAYGFAQRLHRRLNAVGASHDTHCNSLADDPVVPGP
jgi:hypothetical protein